MASHCGNVFMTKTVRRMIVDHADRLHERVADRCSYKFKTPFFQIATQAIRNRRRNRYVVHSPPTVLQGSAVYELPQVAIKGSKFRTHIQNPLGVGNRRLNLESVSDDAYVFEQGVHLAFIVTGNYGGVEPIERAPIIGPFFQDRKPAQPRLGAFKDQKFEKRNIVMNGHSPFVIVIVDVERIGSHPSTAGHGSTRTSALVQAFRLRILLAYDRTALLQSDCAQVPRKINGPSFQAVIHECGMKNLSIYAAAVQLFECRAASETGPASTNRNLRAALSCVNEVPAGP